jgi:molybdopterin converting factor subunit 1
MSVCIVRLFARARDLAGTETLSIDFKPGATIADLRQQLAAAQPALVDLLPRCALAIDAEFAEDAQTIAAGAEIAVLPPVSGGMELGAQPVCLWPWLWTDQSRLVR